MEEIIMREEEQRIKEVRLCVRSKKTESEGGKMR